MKQRAFLPPPTSFRPNKHLIHPPVCPVIHSSTTISGDQPQPPSRPLQQQQQPHPRARRLSLPTTRERRYLHDIRVRRASGRPRYTQTASFSLMAWPLILHPFPDNTTANHTPHSLRPTSKPMSSTEATSSSDTPPTSTFSPGTFDNTTLHSNHRNDEYAGDDSDHNSDSNDDSEYEKECEAPDSSNTPVIGDNMAEIASVDPPFPTPHNKATSSTPPPLSIPTHIPAWAYITSVRTAKLMLGKRSVQRNRAKRRIRAAAAQILPQYAVRHMEYRFTAFPESLVIPHKHLLSDVRVALKAIDCWDPHLTEEMLRRERYCDP